MVMKQQTIAAGEFKATCLSLLDTVARTGRDLVVTKRGKPIARIVPFATKSARRLGDSIAFVADDIVEPTGDDWNADR